MPSSGAYTAGRRRDRRHDTHGISSRLHGLFTHVPHCWCRPVSWRHRLLIVVALAFPAGLALPGKPITIVLLHTNDLHGQVSPRGDTGGLARLATIVRREKPDLLLDAGDMFSGTMASDLFFGKPMIAAMNGLGYAAGTIGNHEFDHGLLELSNRLREARFPVLSANVMGVDEVQPYTVLVVKGMRIGVIGITAEDVAMGTNQKNLKGVKVTYLVDAVREALQKVRPISDFVILLAHTSPEEQARVLRAFPEIQLVVAGDSHVSRATRVGQTLVVEAGSRAQVVGKVTIRLFGNAHVSMTPESIAVQNAPLDLEMQSIVGPYETLVASTAAEQLGDTTADLRSSGTEESALNDLIADALRATANTQLAFHNVGGVRARLKKGPITFGALFDVLPFQDTLVTMNLTGAQIKRVLGRRVQAVSGLRVQWDLTREWPHYLASATLASGEPLQDAVQYTVVVNDFMAAGGDGLEEFTEGTGVQDTGVLLRDAVTAYLRKHPVVSDVTDGRVTIRNR